MWENYGLIFSDTDLKNIDSSLTFAKSPQFLLVDGTPTFYFTSQCKDSQDKWVSLPYWVSFDASLSLITGFSEKAIVESGSLGAFDEHGIFPFSPIKLDEGYLAYTTGWSRKVSVDIDMAIGVCKSEDGLKFERISDGPIMASSLNEPFLVGDAFVKKFHGAFYMWYIYGDKWVTPQQGNEPERRYRIAQAVSSDGLHWSRGGDYIISVNDQNECQALPTVVFFDGKYQMAFCYRDTFDFRNGGEKSYKLGYAFSTDLVTWSRDDTFINTISSRSKWDSEMQCYPNLFILEGALYCAYNGNGFGKGGFGLAKLL